MISDRKKRKGDAYIAAILGIFFAVMLRFGRYMFGEE